jgi:hypothetical protein
MSNDFWKGCINAIPICVALWVIICLAAMLIYSLCGGTI